MKSNFNITYERDAISSYLVIKTDDSIHIENYEVEMIGRNTINSFLDFNVRRLNTEINLYYNITSKQQLTQILERKKLVYNEVKNFFSELIAIIKDCDKYYLSSLKIVFDPSMIYMSPKGFSPHFVYTPFSNMKLDIMDDMKKLIEYLFDKVDQDDVNTVMMMHRLVTASKQQQFNLQIIETIIDQRNSGKDIKQETAIKEVVSDHKDIKDKSDDDYIISRLIEQNRQKEQSAKENNEIKKEKIQQSTNKKKSSITSKSIKIKTKSDNSKKLQNHAEKIKSYLHYISIGCIQIITILIFFIMLKSKVLHSDVTGNIKIESLFAAIAMLFVLNLYGTKKIYNHMLNTKKAEPINMNKQQVYNQPPIDTFCMNARNEKNIFNKSPSVADNGNGDVIKKMTVSIESECGRVKEALIKEPVRKEVSYRGHSNSTDYSSEDTQLLEDYSDRLNIEINPYLLSKDGDMINKIVLSNNPFIIGKLEDQVDYIIENSSVSRFHCKIIKEDNSYYIIDLNSKNGTYLDEERLVSNEKYQLYDGSHIAISSCEYTFELD